MYILFAFWRKDMQTELSVLLLVTASVMLTCVVIGYGVSIFETAMNNADVPELQKISSIKDSVLNQTDNLLNETGLIQSNQTLP
jgi:hypothetical protein